MRASRQCSINLKKTWGDIRRHMAVHSICPASINQTSGFIVSSEQTGLNPVCVFI